MKGQGGNVTISQCGNTTIKYKSLRGNEGITKLTAYEKIDCFVKVDFRLKDCKDRLYLVMEYDPWKRNDLGCLHALLMLPVMLFKELIRIFKK